MIAMLFRISRFSFITKYDIQESQDNKAVQMDRSDDKAKVQ